jgi:multiple antibiotic resistance protein
LVVCIIGVCFAFYLILRIAVQNIHRISPLVLKLTTRLMGLLLAAVAVQFVLNALRQMGVPLQM